MNSLSAGVCCLCVFSCAGEQLHVFLRCCCKMTKPWHLQGNGDAGRCLKGSKRSKRADGRIGAKPHSFPRVSEPVLQTPGKLVSFSGYFWKVCWPQCWHKWILEFKRIKMPFPVLLEWLQRSQGWYSESDGYWCKWRAHEFGFFFFPTPFFSSPLNSAAGSKTSIVTPSFMGALCLQSIGSWLIFNSSESKCDAANSLYAKIFIVLL